LLLGWSIFNKFLLLCLILFCAGCTKTIVYIEEVVLEPPVNIQKYIAKDVARFDYRVTIDTSMGSWHRYLMKFDMQKKQRTSESWRRLMHIFWPAVVEFDSASEMLQVWDFKDCLGLSNKFFKLQDSEKIISVAKDIQIKMEKTNEMRKIGNFSTTKYLLKATLWKKLKLALKVWTIPFDAIPEAAHKILSEAIKNMKEAEDCFPFSPLEEDYLIQGTLRIANFQNRRLHRLIVQKVREEFRKKNLFPIRRELKLTIEDSARTYFSSAEIQKIKVQKIPRSFFYVPKKYMERMKELKAKEGDKK